ncbi:MAG: ABC transporter ATP-binding protein [Anaerolineae bacterium]|nr:ABC transporter ATP-binding protein [Anaerolineae bacterium]
MTLIVSRLSKRYGTQTALHEVNFTLSGGVAALLGANGAGKSTLLQVLATLCPPDAGELSFAGQHYARDQRALRTQIGYLPQDLELPDALTPRKLLTYLARLRGGSPSEVLAALHLEDIADQRFRQLSTGQLRRVGIAQSLLGQPRLLLLDELSRGLDVVERENAYRLVRKRDGLTVFSTHQPEEAERIAQTVIILQGGHVLYAGAIETLRASVAGQVYQVRLPIEHLTQITMQKSVIRVIPQATHCVVRSLNPHSHPEMTRVDATLEDAYLLLIHQHHTPS